ncbi:MAG: tetratricopeptide repeat protein [Wenzhouxiangellaceae bacterium]|nr:tetratricopeptide repeat protein [Wenzhouxiangellaceae bacterium]
MAVELYDEHEQSERVRHWLRENGVSLLMGVILALAGIFGWRQYQEYQDSRAALASDYYTAVQRELDARRVEGAAQQYEAMREAVEGHPYAVMAGQLLASAHVEAGELDAAAAIYEAQLADESVAVLEPVTRLRLARVRAAQGRIDEGLALVDGEAPTGYETLWLETRGDLLFDRGDMDAAAEVYAEAVDRLRGEGGNVRLVELKLDAARSRAAGADAS